MYKLNFKGVEREFNECPEDDDKYIVFTCAKNEEDYIIEWLDYHLGIGFDKVIICDNNDDETILPELLSSYIERGVVEIFDVTDFQKIQSAMFNMFATQGHYKWCAFIDGDEFITISGRYKNVKEMLDDCNDDCLCLNWLIYGTNGLEKKDDRPVQERFPNPIAPILYLKENFYIKSILRKTDNPDLEYLNPHFPENCKSYNYGLEFSRENHTGYMNYNPCYKHAYIRHYLSKSLEEYKAKQARGWADSDDSILRQTSHYDLITSTLDVPTSFLCEGLFEKQVPCFTTESIGKYDFYVVKRGHEGFGYQILCFLIGRIFSQVNDVTIVLDKNIDNNMYTIFLEFAIKTGNRLIACDFDINKHSEMFNRFHKKWTDDYLYLRLP